MRFVGLLVMSATLAAAHGQVPRATKDEFTIVRGRGYRGAIVPVSSLWYALFRDPRINGLERESADLSTVQDWTPSASDVALVERHLHDFVARLSTDPQTVTALPIEDQNAIRNGLPALIYLADQNAARNGSAALTNLADLKRHYAGLRSGAVRRIVVHGFPSHIESTWRSEFMAMKGGGCKNFWLHFNVDEQRIVRFVCAGLE